MASQHFRVVESRAFLVPRSVPLAARQGAILVTAGVIPPLLAVAKSGTTLPVQASALA